MSGELRMQLLGQRTMLLEECAELAETIKTFKTAIIEQLVMADEPEKINVKNLHVNMKGLENALEGLKKRRERISEINAEIG